jgi:mannose-6-phosphate isomerase-like protein (cupin superfamily)
MKRKRRATRQVGGSLLIDPKAADLYESSKPFRRYMKLLIDHAAFPGTPLTVAQATYPPGAKSPSHTHAKTTEIYFVLTGTLVARIHGRRYEVRRGQLLYIPPGKEHQAANRGKGACRFMTINTPLGEDVPELRVRKTWRKLNRRGSLKGSTNDGHTIP